MKRLSLIFLISFSFCALAKAQKIQISTDAGLRYINYNYSDTRLSRTVFPYIYHGLNIHYNVKDRFWLGAGIHSLPTAINVNMMPLNVNVLPINVYDGSPKRSPELSLLGRYHLFNISSRLRCETGLGFSFSRTKYLLEGQGGRRISVSSGDRNELQYQISQLTRHNFYIKPELSLAYKLSTKIDVGFTFQNLFGMKRMMKSEIQYMDNDDGNWHHASITTNGGARHYNLRLIYNIYKQD